MDIIIKNEDEEVFFIEIKCYEFFEENFEEKIDNILQKLKDTLYFLFFFELEDEELKAIREKISYKNPYYVIIICPPCNPNTENVTADKLRTLRDSLIRRLKQFLDYVLVDTKDNAQNLFLRIE